MNRDAFRDALCPIPSAQASGIPPPSLFLADREVVPTTPQGGGKVCISDFHVMSALTGSVGHPIEMPNCDEGESG